MKTRISRGRLPSIWSACPNFGIYRLERESPTTDWTNIAKLSGLLKLCMEGPFTNAGLKHLAKLRNLTTLSLGSEYVTAEGVAVCRRAAAIG